MEKAKVLIVDDDVNFSRMLSDFLRSQYAVNVANNLEDAINIFRLHKHKVVLLDFKMPIVYGDRFLPILQEINPAVRVIVVTGCLGEEVEEKFKGLGYFAFFEKGGLSLQKLKGKVEEAVRY